VKKNFINQKNFFNKKVLNQKLILKNNRIYNKIFYQLIQNINNNKKTLNILSNTFKFNFNSADLKRFKKFKTIAMIGMGGSILGAQAIYSFLKKKIKKKIIFFDNLNDDKIKNFQKNTEKRKTLFLVISKSGNTIETITNLRHLKILKKNTKNIIIISEKNKNLLFSISRKYNLKFIEHKKHVGGRYSVLSEVGMLPALLMGVDTRKIRLNLELYFKSNKKFLLKQSSITLANLLYKKKLQNIIFLNYIPELEKFLFWCQQLIAESLGKKGKGFLPVVSNVPKDHHSLLQLYLDGPRDKLFYIFSLENKNKKNNLNLVKDAQIRSLKKILIKKNIPFREFTLNKISEETIGQLFSYFILETVIVGKLTKINPFDQPAVEQIKNLTKKFLN
tara:strand:- start:173 stop:1342 length:1170 start_codon:yes stop_codon:yes gene_type:complete